MNIAFLEPHLKLVGGIRRILEISNRLITRGHTVSIFTPPGTPCRWLHCSARIDKLSTLHNHTFDIVIFNLAENYIWAQKANAKKKVFWVLAPEALYKNPTIPTLALKQDFYFMANSAFTANYITTIRKVPYTIPIIPGGINPQHFKYDPSIPRLRHVLYYGSARPWKGTAIIEHALLGSGLKYAKMDGAGVAQDQLYTSYNSADVFVSACQAEGFSFPELEAMRCGTVVVCTDSGGNREFVKNKWNALVVPRNSDALRTGIRLVLGNKELYRTLRKNGLTTANDPRYDWDNITGQLEQTLKQCLA